MIHKIFSVFDSKAEGYLQPFFLQTKGQAIRSFTDAVNDAGHQFHRHAEDFTLFEIGEYDDSTAILTSLSVHQPLGKAIEYLRQIPDLKVVK